MNVRPAVKSDYEAVVELSQGIYDGLDYLPVVFHEWLTQPKRVLFVAEMEGEIIGAESMFFIDEGETAIGGAWRIHPRYRGRRLGSKMTGLILECVKQHYPKVFQLRLAGNLNVDPNKTILQCTRLIFSVTKDYSIPYDYETLKEVSGLKLSRYSRQEFSDVILDKPMAEVLFKEHLLLINAQPFEAERYNLDLMVNEGDCLLADQSAKDYSRGMVPKSFSHGRLSPRVAYCVWITAIRTDDPALFAAHLLKQLRVARETIEGDFVLSLFCLTEKHKDYGGEICEDKLGLKLRENLTIFVRQVNPKEQLKKAAIQE